MTRLPMQVLLLAFASVVVVSVASASPVPEAPAARTILLVRHGHYISDPADPSPGPGLSPLGIAQAQLAAARIAGLPDSIDAIFASPMTRAHETAKVIAADLPGRSIEILPDLAECTPATRRTEITAKETPEKMAACAAGLDKVFAARFIPARGAPRREILVCHGNVIRYLTTRALGVDTEAWLEMSVGNASLTQILVEPDGRFKIIAVGDTGHLPPNMLTGATGMSDRSLSVPK